MTLTLTLGTVTRPHSSVLAASLRWTRVHHELIQLCRARTVKKIVLLIIAAAPCLFSFAALAALCRAETFGPTLAESPKRSVCTL